MPRIADIEARWGLPFTQLVADLHAQDLSMRDAGRALGFETRCQYSGFWHRLNRLGDANPWARSTCIPAQYTRDTGESFRDACVRLSKTHTLSAAAREIGYAGNAPFVHAMVTRGICLEFQKVKARPKPAATPRRITYADLLEYGSRRLAGETATRVAASLGWAHRALWGAFMRAMPEEFVRKVRAEGKKRKSEAKRKFVEQQLARARYS